MARQLRFHDEARVHCKSVEAVRTEAALDFGGQVDIGSLRLAVCNEGVVAAPPEVQIVEIDRREAMAQ